VIASSTLSRSMRPTATVTSSQPDATIAARIASGEEYLPVPVISRERGSRPAMTSGSFMGSQRS